MTPVLSTTTTSMFEDCRSLIDYSQAMFEYMIMEQNASVRERILEDESVGAQFYSLYEEALKREFYLFNTNLHLLDAQVSERGGKSVIKNTDLPNLHATLQTNLHTWKKHGVSVAVRLNMLPILRKLHLRVRESLRLLGTL